MTLAIPTSFQNHRHSASSFQALRRKKSIGNHAEVERMTQKLLNMDQENLDKLYQ